MVFQRKSGGKGNKSPFQGKNKKPFEHKSELDDQLMKKTPKGKQLLGTPKGKQVSFHIPGKNTPANKTPKFVAKTPNSGEKKLLTPGYKGTTMKGMKAGFSRPKNGKVKDDDSSGDDEDDDDDDDDEDFELDLGGGGGGDEDDDEEEGDGNEDDDDDDDEDDDDEEDDDDDEEDDDDDDEDDDDDDDEDDDDDGEMLDKHKKVMKTNKEEKVKTPKSEKVEAAKPGKNTQVVESEAKSSPKKVPDQNVQQAIARQMESSRERNLRTLYIGNLPLDIKPEEIKALSSDILEVIIPKGNYRSLPKKRRTLFAFMVFKSEEKAEANYKDLQEQKLRGAKMRIDFAGEKSKNKKVSEKQDSAKNINLKQLFVQGFPSKITIDKVAEIFPESYQIILTKTNCAHVTFATADEAAAGFEAGKKATVKETQLHVKYAILNRSFSPNKRKEHFKKPFQKKMKLVKGGGS